MPTTMPSRQYHDGVACLTGIPLLMAIQVLQRCQPCRPGREQSRESVPCNTGGESLKASLAKVSGKESK